MMITNNEFITPYKMELLLKTTLRCKVTTNRCFLRCPVWDQATHHFPNHKKHHDRFKAWVEAIGRTLETDEDYEYFRTKRLCHIHFKPIFCYNDRRLSPLAIPTLYLTKESRNEYWSKDLELRKSMLQSNSPQDEVVKADRPMDVAKTPKDDVKTSYKDPLMDVPVEIPSNKTPNSLRSEAPKSLVNLLIADTLGDENVNPSDDVQEKPMTDLSAPSPVESKVPTPVADIIIEYISTTDVSSQKLVMKHIPRDIMTSEVVEMLPQEPICIHDLPVYSTMEICSEEIVINSSCIQQRKKKRKCKYDGITWDMPARIPMEHNYSKASIVSSTSHISSNGMHPKRTIITLKRQVSELRKKLKFYKKKCKDLLLKNQNQETGSQQSQQIKSKTISKISQKGQASRTKVHKNIINYLKHKNFGGINLPRNK